MTPMQDIASGLQAQIDGSNAAIQTLAVRMATHREKLLAQRYK